MAGARMTPFGNNIPQGLFANAANLTAQAGATKGALFGKIGAGLRSLGQGIKDGELRDEAKAERDAARAESSRRFDIQEGRHRDEQAFRVGVASLRYLSEQEQTLGRAVDDLMFAARSGENVDPSKIKQATDQLGALRERKRAKASDVFGMDLATGSVTDPGAAMFASDAMFAESKAGAATALDRKAAATVGLEAAKRKMRDAKNASQRSTAERAAARFMTDLFAIESEEKVAKENRVAERRRRAFDQVNAAKAAKFEASKPPLLTFAGEYIMGNVPEGLRGDTRLHDIIRGGVSGGVLKSDDDIRGVVKDFVEANKPPKPEKPPKPTAAEKAEAEAELAAERRSRGLPSKLDDPKDKDRDGKPDGPTESEKRAARSEAQNMVKDAISMADKERDALAKAKDGDDWTPDEAKAYAVVAMKTWRAVYGKSATEEQDDAAWAAIEARFSR